MPRIKRTLDTTDEQVGREVTLNMPAEGPLSQMVREDQRLENELVTVGADGLDNSYAAQLAFYEEPVEVTVHETTDEFSDPIVDLYCNGVPQRLIRGQPQVIKRKYVEILARARVQSMKTRVDIQQDNIFNRIDKHTALKYPFSVSRDDNPKGRDWLRATLAAAV